MLLGHLDGSCTLRYCLLAPFWGNSSATDVWEEILIESMTNPEIFCPNHFDVPTTAVHPLCHRAGFGSPGVRVDTVNLRIPPAYGHFAYI